MNWFRLIFNKSYSNKWIKRALSSRPLISSSDYLLLKSERTSPVRVSSSQPLWTSLMMRTPEASFSVEWTSPSVSIQSHSSRRNRSQERIWLSQVWVQQRQQVASFPLVKHLLPRHFRCLLPESLKKRPRDQAQLNFQNIRRSLLRPGYHFSICLGKRGGRGPQ